MLYYWFYLELIDISITNIFYSNIIQLGINLITHHVIYIRTIDLPFFFFHFVNLPPLHFDFSLRRHSRIFFFEIIIIFSKELWQSFAYLKIHWNPCTKNEISTCILSFFSFCSMILQCTNTHRVPKWKHQKHCTSVIVYTFSYPC